MTLPQELSSRIMDALARMKAQRTPKAPRGGMVLSGHVRERRTAKRLAAFEARVEELERRLT